jgi:two-component system nitrogen regulation response regulator GlnG/two-component system response regulator HydG
VGEIALLDDLEPSQLAWFLGRDTEHDPSARRVRFVRQRPNETTDGGPLVGHALSRRQLYVERRPEGIHIENKGNAKLFVNGASCETALITGGDVVELRGHYAFLVAMRAATLTSAHGKSAHAFGEPDAQGILGESEAAWRLRDTLAFAAKATPHVLLRGESGTGKELAARCVHALSVRASKPLLARNAATLPTALLDAELFGNMRNYPNAGTPERTGLIGEADGGVLFLDEIAELPSEMQAHLLRVLDTAGEYHRLGEAKPRRADIRLIGATNRAISAVKYDLLARLTLVIELPSLEERREDIPLLARHLVLEAARKNPEIADRFVRRDNRYDQVRFAPSLIVELLRRSYPANVRELDKILWQCMAVSLDGTLRLPEHPRAGPAPQAPAPDALTSDVEVDQLLAGLTRKTISEEAIRESLRAHRTLGKAAKALGVSRWALDRLIKKYGLRRA